MIWIKLWMHTLCWASTLRVSWPVQCWANFAGWSNLLRFLTNLVVKMVQGDVWGAFLTAGMGFTLCFLYHLLQHVLTLRPYGCAWLVWLLQVLLEELLDLRTHFLLLLKLLNEVRGKVSGGLTWTVSLRSKVLLHARSAQQILLLSVVLVEDSINFPLKSLVAFTFISSRLLLRVLLVIAVLRLKGLEHVLRPLEFSFVLFFSLLFFSLQVPDS